MCHSQNGAGLEVFLIHPLGLADLQDLCVAQVLQATLELVQRIRLESERSHDLLPHHLHYLWTRAERPGDIITSPEDKKGTETCMSLCGLFLGANVLAPLLSTTQTGISMNQITSSGV